MGRSFEATRWVVVAGSLAAWSLAAVSGAPALVALQWLAASVMMAASICSARSSVVGRLPVGALLWVCWILTWSELEGLTVRESAPPWWLSAWGPVVLAAALVLGRRPRSRVTLLFSGEIPAAATALLLLGVGAFVVAFRPFEIWSRNFFYGTDFTRHVTLIGDQLEGAGGAASGYPMGFHEIAGWGLLASGVEPSPRALWIAAAAVVWLCVSLTLLGIGLSVQRLSVMTRVGRQASWALVALAGVTYVQSFWFDRMMSEGYVINYLMGLALVAGVAGMAESDWWDSRYGLLGSATVVSVTANAWQLFLAVAASVAVVTSLHWLRVTRRVMPVLAAAAMVALLSWQPTRPWLVAMVSGPAEAGSTPEGVGGWMSVQTPTGLGPPGWWWWVGLALSLVSVAWGARSGNRLWALAQGLMLAAAAATFLWMYLSVGGAWYFLAYYPAKFLSTALLLLIPLGVVGLGVVVSTAWALASRSWSPMIGRAIVMGVVALGLVGAAGWSAAKPPRLLLVGTSGLGLPPFNLAMAEHLADLDVPRDTGAIVFGLLPDATSKEVLGGAAVVDSVAMETLGLAGFDTTIGEQARGHVLTRTWDQICLWLKEYPKGIVVTGPNPKAGLPWLRDSGCPEEWISPDRWVAVPLDDGWMAGLEVADREFRYPTFEQFVRESQVNQAEPSGRDAQLLARPAAS